MNRTFSVLFAATAVAAGTAALPARAMMPDPATSASVAVEKPAASSTRYCIVEKPTGTLIGRKICKTHAAWLRAGFDPLTSK